MSQLIDRLIGYDQDLEKLPIHQFLDALYLRETSFPQKPTDAEIVSEFGLTGTEVTDAQLLIALVAGGTRSVRDIEAIFRLAERYPDAIPKTRLLAMLGL